MSRSPTPPNDSPWAPAHPRLVALPRGTLVALREGGVDVDGIARELGVADPEMRLPSAQAEALLDRMLGEVSDPAFGLNAGARVPPELFGVVGFAAMSAPTFREALARISRYKCMCSPDRLTLVPGGDTTAVQFTVARPERRGARMRVDAELSFMLAFGRRMTQAPITPRGVAISGPAPSCRDRYRAVFGCPVRFEQPVDEIAFAESDLARPLISRSPELAEIFGERAEQLLAESGRDDVVERVRAALLRMLRGDAPALAEVARAVGQSERSLQRRLAESGVSFAGLLDEVRREIARDRLAHTDIDVAELSFLLGFSNPNSLHRAFKRWERTTPISYRRAARRAAV
jgi:AraC-like DNA-binding protein